MTDRARLRRVLGCSIFTAGAVVACSTNRTEDTRIPYGEKTVTVRQDIRLADYTGTSLPAKTLALTFDDGPGARTAELSQYLKAQGIKAAFFVNGSCIAATALPNPNCGAPLANAAAVLAQIVADGHLVANHTVTHRDMATTVPNNQRVQELSETDAAIAAYIPSGHFLFRPPFGSWNQAATTTIQASAMNKYIGPINWEVGGFSDQYPQKAADWACWQGQQGKVGGGLANGNGFATTTQCGDAYLTEINAIGKGIVLLHDPYSWAQGSTVDMIKYIVPILKAANWSFVRVDEVPTIAADLPGCHASCKTCSGPAANQCTACNAGDYLNGGQCKTCSTCAAGSYVATACGANANTVCAACDASCATCTGPAGTQCASCGAGKYLENGQCKTCSNCAADTYQVSNCTANADRVCGACDASCATCTGPANTQCASCGAGKYLENGQCKTCSNCAAGTYPSAACTANADTACGACHASCSVCSGPAANQCGSCPAGFFVENNACKACSVCPAGTSQTTACTANADATCTSCAPGSASTTAGAPSCTTCPAGTFAAAAGSKACTPCEAGKFSAAGATSCGACEPGTFTAGESACHACPDGTFAATSGASACAACGSCDDGDACTRDACDAKTGCTHAKIDGCPASQNTSSGEPGQPNDPAVNAGGTGGCNVGHRSSPRDAGSMLLGMLGLAWLVRRRRS